jgi:hypothetical protein
LFKDYFSDENSDNAGDSNQSCTQTDTGAMYDSIGTMSAAAAAAQRQKRMRTSFKHHQLRVMKSYFELNHNPDAKDLKQLSQKTGLSKRVLQVWFQNARAKYRRNQTGTDSNCESTTSKTVATSKNYNTSPTSPLNMQNQSVNNSLLLNQNTDDLQMSIDDINVLNHHQIYHHHHHHHQNSTTDTSSLNDLDLICNDEDDDQGDENDQYENDKNMNDENIRTTDLSYNFDNIRYNKQNKFRADLTQHHQQNENSSELL